MKDRDRGLNDPLVEELRVALAMLPDLFPGLVAFEEFARVEEVDSLFEEFCFVVLKQARLAEGASTAHDDAVLRDVEVPCDLASEFVGMRLVVFHLRHHRERRDDLRDGYCNESQSLEEIGGIVAEEVKRAGAT